ncbi:MAG TPA: ABC transporter permease subunit [Jiangellaceae bacterium]|nr:ABC transporter permease subunit [Jiangellaceae bacterium]
MVLALAAGLVIWMIVAARTPDYVLPPLADVVNRTVELFSEPDQRWNWILTVIRIMLGLVTAFAIGTALGLAMGRSRRLTNIFMPYLQITQGIPSLAWVIIAIIWFQTVEVRIWFLLLMVTLPGFAFQAQDSYRAIPRELQDMAKSLRPRRRRLDMFRTITLPAIIPDLLTAWKINLGLGTRVVLIAEFAGASVGVGYRLLIELQFFRMDGVIAWTASLVIFVLIIQQIIAAIERRLLRYRPGGAIREVGETEQQDPRERTSAVAGGDGSSTGRAGGD